MARRPVRAVPVLIAAALLAAGCSGGDDDRTQIEFFMFKPEAVQTFTEIVADFEAENPDIDVQQNNVVTEAATAMRTRLVRNDLPDVITLNADGNFGEFSAAEVFYDWSSDPIVEDIRPSILDIINDLGVANEGEVNGLPFANNADGVIYNKDLFAQYGVEVPTTWDELIAAAETFQQNDVLPFYVTLKDQWTSQPAWNALASNLAPDDFFDKLRADETSFAEDHEQVADRMYELFSFGQEDRFARDYNTGNQTFAEGGSAMYLQGVWAISAIRTYEPDFEIGVFPLPMDTPEETRLVSGVDVAITMPREPEHPEESKRFIDYLMSPEVTASYAEAQSAFPTLEDTEASDPALTDLQPYFDEDRLVGFSDHQIPASIPLAAINQQFLIDGDQEAYLAALDEDWDKVAKRRPDRG